MLPSSIHEVLLLKDDGMTDYHTLEAMVTEINAIRRNCPMRNNDAITFEIGRRDLEVILGNLSLTIAKMERTQEAL